MRRLGALPFAVALAASCSTNPTAGSDASALAAADGSAHLDAGAPPDAATAHTDSGAPPDAAGLPVDAATASADVGASPDAGPPPSPDSGGWSPPAVCAACASPAPGQPAFIPPADENVGKFPSMAAAWGGAEAAVAFAETGAALAKVRLQRLTPAGALLGTAIELGDFTSTGMDEPRVALATDGARYVACWDSSSTSLACASAPVGGGSASPGFTVAGSDPCLAFGPGGFALAYQGSTQVGMQLLDGAATARGTGAFPVTATGLRPRLAATVGGYSLAVGSGTAPLTLYRTSPTLSPIGSPTQLSATWNAAGGALSSSGGALAALWIEGAQVSLVIVDAQGVPGATLRADAPQFPPVYKTLALAGGADSFFMTFGDTYSLSQVYRSATTAGALGTPSNLFSIDQLEPRQLLLAVPGGALFFELRGWGQYDAQTLSVLLLGCP
jgi:hypothetical protein